jgi:hypothetical protein
MQNVVYECIFLGKEPSDFVGFSQKLGSPSNSYEELF